MKFNNISIKWRIFTFLTGFCAILLVLLWLFQVVLLEGFYERIKIREIKNSANSIIKNINNNELETLIDRISTSNDICIEIFSNDWQELYKSHVNGECIIHKMSLHEKNMLYRRTEKSGGVLLQSSNKVRVRDIKYNDKDFIGRVPPPDKRMLTSILYTHIITDNQGNEYILLLNSRISPVDSTIQTLRVQFYYIAGVMLILSILIALIIAKRVSKPIVAINISAKELAKGNYDTRFNGMGYKEIAELSETLNYAAKELSKVENLRRELIANISHDLRTPLTLITGYSEVMRDLPNENTPENVQVIIDEAKRLTTLVNDMLDISKLQSGTQEFNITEFNITDTIKNTIDRFSKLCKQNGYTINFIWEENILVMADELRISQVIYNLLNNAITHTGQDKLVTVRQTRIEDKVKIEVIDTGDGIDEDKIPYIWDRYYKVDKTHKRAVTGTGLGLSIVKSILDMHQAKYGVSTKQDQGSIFWFELKI